MPLGFFLALAGGLVAPAFRGATRKLAIGRPSWGGEFPIRTEIAIRITLLTLPAMMLSAWRFTVARPDAKPPPSAGNGAARRARPRN